VESMWFLASLWLGLALVATLAAIWLRISTALSEILVGTVASWRSGRTSGSPGLAPRRLGSRSSPAPARSC